MGLLWEYVTNKQAVNDKTVALAFHENSLFSDKAGYLIFNPSTDMQILPSCCLHGAIVAIEK